MDDDDDDFGFCDCGELADHRCRCGDRRCEWCRAAYPCDGCDVWREVTTTCPCGGTTTHLCRCGELICPQCLDCDRCGQLHFDTYEDSDEYRADIAALERMIARERVEHRAAHLDWRSFGF